MTSNATAGDETRINTYTTSFQARATLSALDDGGWIAVWISGGQDGDGNGVYQQRYDADGAMVGIETRVNTVTTGNQSFSTTTALSDGGWLVAWTSEGPDGDGRGVYQQRYDADGLLFGAETQVNTYTTGDQYDPQTTAFADGGWVVTWRSLDQDGDGAGIYQQHYNAAGATVGTEIRVNSVTTGAQDNHDISALADGGWIVTWTSDDPVSQSKNISQQRYDADDGAVETDALVNTHTTDQQNGSHVAGLADGGWVVAWYSIGQDGSGEAFISNAMMPMATVSGSRERSIPTPLATRLTLRSLRYPMEAGSSCGIPKIRMAACAAFTRSAMMPMAPLSVPRRWSTSIRQTVRRPRP